MKRYIRNSSNILDIVDEMCYQTIIDNEGSRLSISELVDVIIENLSYEGYELGVDYSKKDVRDALEDYEFEI